MDKPKAIRIVLKERALLALSRKRKISYQVADTKIIIELPEHMHLDVFIEKDIANMTGSLNKRSMN